MGKTFVLYIKYLGILGYISICLDIFTGLGAFELYTKTPILQDFPIWGWLIFLIIGLLFTTFYAFHKLRKNRDVIIDELEKIKNQRPEIETNIKRQHNDFDIEVLNKGEDAEFEAQIEILSGNHFVYSLRQNYSTYWEKTKTDKTELQKGQKDLLKVASLKIETSPVNIMNYCLHYYEISHFENSTFPRIGYAHSTSWIPGNNQVVKPRVSLKITISSKPSMIEGPVIKTYELSDEGLIEKTFHES